MKFYRVRADIKRGFLECPPVLCAKCIPVFLRDARESAVDGQFYFIPLPGDNVCDVCGIGEDRNGQARRAWYDIPVDEIVNMKNDGLSLREIAQLFGCSKSLVHDKLKRGLEAASNMA